MYPVILDKENFVQLKDQVVVLTGGASGIGAATTKLLCQHGAQVYFGDVNAHLGRAYEQNLSKELASNNRGGTANFTPCDVTKYDEIYNLFRTALQRHGAVHHAIACAGVVDTSVSPLYFDQTLDVENVAKGTGDMTTLNVNFIGSCAFARIALPFLRHGRRSQQDRLETNGNVHAECDRSLTFSSSVTGFRDAPGMFLYQVRELTLARSHCDQNIANHSRAFIDFQASDSRSDA